MLMRFSISNFMSFGYKIDQEGNPVSEEFYLYSGRSEQFKDRVVHLKGRKILKFASIYGANASGKTNLIRAIDCGRRILLSTMDEGHFEDKYCRSKKQNKNMPTLFEYEFTLGQQCFAYGFTVNLNRKCVLSEWLYELHEKNEHIIFERQVEQDQYYFDEKRFDNPENVQQFHYYMKDANQITSSLLLYEMNRRKLQEKDFEIFSKIYRWFRNKLVVIYPETKIGSSYRRFGNDNANLVNVLDYLDTGITGYEMRTLSENAFKEYFLDVTMAEKFLKGKGILIFGGALFELDGREGGTKKIEKLTFQHGPDETSYEYGEESDGTQRLIELLDVILDDDGERVFMIDELDRSLHPQMTIKFVEMFLKFSKNKNTQMIITTHESNLMDLKILRQDEIWFTERENDNTTTLYTLEKFQNRYGKPVFKEYLDGRYGAVPVFKDFEYVFGRDED